MNRLIISNSKLMESTIPKLVITEPVPLRAHHWLCLPGYEGKGYNQTHANNWDFLSQLFTLRPETKVQVVKNEDTLCLRCPNSKSEKGTCIEKYVKKLDDAVMNILKLTEGGIYVYGEKLEQLRSILTSQKHAEICGDCEWRFFGLCKDTFKKNET